MDRLPGEPPGAPRPRDRPQGATLVTVEDREVARVEHRDLDVFRWAARQVDLRGAADTGEALDRVREALEDEVATAEGRGLAVRLRLEGACPAHEELAADPGRWVQECRAIASGMGEGAVWIEKVALRTRSAREQGEATASDEALGGLLRSLRDLEADPAPLAALAAELGELRRKLPAELFTEGEALDPSDSEALRGLLGEVGDLLVARLLARVEEPPA